MEDVQSILAHIPAALLVIFRIGGLAIFAPVFGSSTIPVRVRVFLAFLVGLAAYPVVPTDHIVRPDIRIDLWMLAGMAATELCIGLVIGFVASLPLLALETGGLIMGQQMGLGFARFYNPAVDDEADIVGQLLFFMALAAFLRMGGHEWMMLAVLHSFERIQIGGFAPDLSLIDLVVGVIHSSLELALRVAAPMLGLVFLETIAMGFLSKTVPQLNVLSLGFPIRIIMGIGAVAAGLVVINDVSNSSINEMGTAVMNWIEQHSWQGGE